MKLEAMPLSSLATVNSGGGAPQDPDAFTTTGFPFVRAGSLPKLLDGESEGSLEQLSPEVAEEHGLSLFPAGTVLFAKSGMSATKGHVYRLKTPAYVVNHLAALIPHLPEDSAFLVRVLQHFSPTTLIKDDAYPSIRLGDIENMKVRAPPDSDGRRRIAEILDSADALRAKRRAALTQLDTLTQSIFLDMFGDPATNPKGWARPSLAELLNGAEVFVDGDWVESKDQDPEGEVRLIQLADIGDGVYLDKSARFLTKQTALRLKCTPLKVDDVLVARMPDPLGRACLFPGDEREAVTVVDVCIIRPATQGPHPVWLMCCINTSAFRSQIAREATGTTRKRISRGNLAKLRVISPPRELQESFVRQYRTVSDLRARQRASLEELDGLFASLQHRAFRGEL